MPAENIRKLMVFWCFQAVSKEISGMKWVNKIRMVRIDYFLWDDIEMSEQFQKLILYCKKCCTHKNFWSSWRGILLSRNEMGSYIWMFKKNKFHTNFFHRIGKMASLCLKFGKIANQEIKKNNPSLCYVNQKTWVSRSFLESL